MCPVLADEQGGGVCVPSVLGCVRVGQPAVGLAGRQVGQSLEHDGCGTRSVDWQSSGAGTDALLHSSAQVSIALVYDFQN